jgi:hypothetical protein
MDRSKVIYVIDIGLIITFFTSFITGLIKFPGLLNTFGISQFSLPIPQLSVIHDWSGVTMGLLVLFHLILHFRWIAEMTKKIFRGGKQNA